MKRLGTVMALLTAAFSTRVAGQEIQRWSPQPWLPGFADWQGSGTPYPVLIAIQLAILAAMIYTTMRVWTGALSSSRRALAWSAWLGAIYMAASVARIAVGLAWAEAPKWFSAYISGVFHLVLAGFVLAVARYHWLKVRGGSAR